MDEDAATLCKRFAYEFVARSKVLFEISSRWVELSHPLVGEFLRKLRIEARANGEDVCDPAASQNKLVLRCDTIAQVKSIDNLVHWLYPLLFVILHFV